MREPRNLCFALRIGICSRRRGDGMTWWRLVIKARCSPRTTADLQPILCSTNRNFRTAPPLSPRGLITHRCHHCSRVTDAESRSQATRPLRRQQAIMAGPLSLLIRQSHFPAAFPAGGANATGRITLSLHAPTPVVPRITHPNCGVGRRGGNLPARAATPPLPGGASGTPG